ncbi:DUF21-domain-containing protein [Polyporus arcularius HHB13444]|uniref:DUF21-domain-containing protein n=1 Tax=Polyporus arcularius HHB13444 TaxID=1314778 RepID=A0A5C3P046_9APHY|nr:DUF21-domain-containing protein [Polyporus arcularius HHB13444]
MLLALFLALARPTNAFPTIYSLLAQAPVPDEPGEHPGSPEFVYKLVVSIVLVLAGGVFAGLTLGLMGLDELHLRVLSTSSDDPKERKNAQKVLSLLSQGRHWVLVVLLLGNVIVNESLPIFLDSALGGGIPAVAMSTAMIGAIIPQAVSVRYGLAIGASCAPIVRAMMYIFAPIAWPIAKLLDYVLGANETHTYKKAELKSFLAFHRQGEEPLRDDEISILNGVLELNNKKVEQIMTPMEDVVTISADRILDHETVDWLLRSGYSRIPVHKPGHPLTFIGILLVKMLSVYDPASAIPVSEFPLSLLPEAPPTINCFQALDYFQTGRAHLLLLSRTPGVEGGAIGVITLEDIIEEIISEEIVDETDRYEDNVSKKSARRRRNASVMKGIIEYRVSRTNSFNAETGDHTAHPSRNPSPLPTASGGPGRKASANTTSTSWLASTPRAPSNLRATSTLSPTPDHPNQSYGTLLVGSPRDDDRLSVRSGRSVGSQGSRSGNRSSTRVGEEESRETDRLLGEPAEDGNAR